MICPDYCVMFGAAAAAFLLGWVWWLPGVFGAAWQAEIGKTKEQRGSSGKAMVMTFLGFCLSAYVLGSLIVALEFHSYHQGGSFGIIVGIAFVGSNMYSDYLFCGNSLKLLAINAGYRVVSFMIMGAILGGML